MTEATLRVFRGDRESGKPADFQVPLVPGMVVLDALHSIQSHQAPTSPCAGIARQGNADRVPLR